MPNQVYQVIQSIKNLDSETVNSLTKQCREALSSLVGEKIESGCFIKTQMSKFCGTTKPQNIANIGYRYLREGKRIEILVDKTKDQNPISFDDFLQYESVKYWLEQLTVPDTKISKKIEDYRELRKTYAYQVWKFCNWLYLREIECHISRHI